MNRSVFYRAFHLAMLAGVIFFVSGCTPSIDGKYEDANGLMSVEIKSDKATVKSLGTTMDTDVKREGDKITLTYQGEPVVFTRKPDGNLESDHLKLIKK